MIKIKNTSPIGDLDVPLLGRVVAVGEVVEVTIDQAQRLMRQSDVWQLADVDTSQRPSESDSKAKWVAFAEHLGIEVVSGMTKSDLIEATKPAEAEGDGVLGVGADGLPIIFDAGDTEDTNTTTDAALAAKTQGE